MSGFSLGNIAQQGTGFVTRQEPKPNVQGERHMTPKQPRKQNEHPRQNEESDEEIHARKRAIASYKQFKQSQSPKQDLSMRRNPAQDNRKQQTEEVRMKQRERQFIPRKDDTSRSNPFQEETTPTQITVEEDIKRKSRENRFGLKEENKQTTREEIKQKPKEESKQKPKEIPKAKQKEETKQQLKKEVNPRVERPQRSSESLMCHANEAKRREETNYLSVFEMNPGLDLTQEAPSVNLKWAVKTYLRADSHNEGIRDQETLTKTIHHLVYNVLDVDTSNPLHFTLPINKSKHTFQEIYSFVSDRMRAVAKDYKNYTKHPNEQLIKDHEIMVRFFIMCNSQGLELEDFNPKINDDRIKDLLKLLIEAYSNLRRSNIFFNSEAEMTEYYIISSLDRIIDPSVLIKTLPEEICDTENIQRAIELMSAYNIGNYVQFFNIAKTAPYLVACMMIPKFDRVRTEALEPILKENIRQKLLADFVDELFFASEDEALDFLEARDARVIDKYIDIAEEETQQVAFTLKEPPQNIEEKRPDKRLDIVYLDSKSYLVEGHSDAEMSAEEDLENELSPATTPDVNISVKDIPAPDDSKQSIPKVETPKQIEIPKETPSVDLFNPKLLPKEPTVTQIPPKDTNDKIIQIPVSKPIEKPEVEAPEPSFIEPPKVHIPIIPKPQVSKRKKSNEWRFPTEDDDIKDLCESREEWKSFHLESKKYRKKQHLKRYLNLSQTEKARGMLYFYRWKHWFFTRRFKIYCKERLEFENEQFSSQFTTKKISDENSARRLKKAKQTNVDVYDIKFTSEELIQLADTYEVEYAKFHIIATQGIELFNFAVSRLTPILNDLRKRGIYISSNPSTTNGSDLLIILAFSDELLQYEIGQVSKIIILLYDHSIAASLSKRLKFQCKSIDIVKVYDPDFASLYEMHDLIWRPICSSFKEIQGPFYRNMEKVNVQCLVQYYYSGLERIPDEIKQKMLTNDYSEAYLWVNYVNSISEYISRVLNVIYRERPPFSNLLKKFGLDLTLDQNSFMLTEKLFSMVRFPYLPQIDKNMMSKHIFAMFYEYAAEFIYPFEMVFDGIGNECLKYIHEVFATSYVSHNPERNYLCAPVGQFFTALLSVVFDYIEKMPLEVIWDDSFEDVTVPRSKSFIASKIDLSSEVMFNDIVGDKVFQNKMNSLYYA